MYTSEALATSQPHLQPTRGLDTCREIPVSPISDQIHLLRDTSSLTHNTRQDIEELFRMTRELGFHGYMLTIEEPQSLNTRRQLLLALDQTRLERYWNTSLMSTDPVVSHARQFEGTFQWHGDAESAGQKNRPLLNADVTNAFDNTYGVTFSRHLPRQGMGAFFATVNGRNMPQHLAIRSGNLAPLQKQFSRALKNVIECWGGTPSKVQLSPKEYEAVYWAAHGKSSQETANHMKLAEVTVRFHLKSVKAKLQSQNKTQSVAKAIALGLVQL